MTLKELLKKNRSFRRFEEAEKLATSVLESFIENVRYTPSPANMQPLKYVLVNNQSVNEQIFPHLGWAAYLKEWPGPPEGERPAAYIVLLGNRRLSRYIDWDYGIALQTILLSATEKGYGGCAIASCNREKIREILAFSDDYEIGCVIALGVPLEKVVVDPVKQGNIKYWRDDRGVHHVPKRGTEELIYKVIE